MPLIPAQELEQLGCQIFQAAGTPAPQATELANALVESNLTGHDSHGVQYIPPYVEGIRRGWIVPSATPIVSRKRASTVVVDGCWGFGHITARFGTEVAVQQARDKGVAAVSVVRCNHTGRVGRYAERAAAAGCIGAFLIGRIHPPGSVAPFGGAGRALTPNPISFSVPAGESPPMIIDFATSTVAESKIKAARARHDRIPLGWIVDKEGNPSSDPADLYSGGMLQTFGEHKGYALALLAAVLGGVATGAEALEEDKPAPDNPWGHGGLLILCLDPSAFVDSETYGEAVDRFFHRVKSVPPATGFEEVLIPGEPELREREQRQRTGIPVPTETWNEILATARHLGVDISSARNANCVRGKH